MIKPKNVRFLNPGENLRGEARSGISLHCHTLHSKENLDFVPYYAERIPFVAYLWRRELRRCISMYGRPPAFDTGHWAPPLTGEQVIGAERESMASLGLDGIVSITDHDSIDANLEICRDHDAESPISMEWTVPFDIGFFHVGVHNLPPSRADEITKQLLDYTYAEGEPDDERLRELLSMLNECPSVLVVLNHPIWDIEMIGQQTHERILQSFLDVHAEWFHAIEINGFRTWDENESAVKLAERLGMPVVSGGDRHCMHSNTMINVTNAATFNEFVDEVRVDGHSRMAVTPEYNVPLPARQLASIAQILGNFQHFPEGRRLWSDRVYLDANDGLGLRTLTDHWNGRPPLWSRLALGALAVMSHPLMRPLIGLTVGDKDIGREDSTPERGDFTIGGTPLVAGGLTTK